MRAEPVKHQTFIRAGLSEANLFQLEPQFHEKLKGEAHNFQIYPAMLSECQRQIISPIDKHQPVTPSYDKYVIHKNPNLPSPTPLFEI